MIYKLQNQLHQLSTFQDLSLPDTAGFDLHLSGP